MIAGYTRTGSGSRMICCGWFEDNLGQHLQLSDQRTWSNFAFEPSHVQQVRSSFKPKESLCYPRFGANGIHHSGKPSSKPTPIFDRKSQETIPKWQLHNSRLQGRPSHQSGSWQTFTLRKTLYSSRKGEDARCDVLVLSLKYLPYASICHEL